MGEGTLAGRVTGIGGLFFRSADPPRLAAWYRTQLGFAMTGSGEEDSGGGWIWRQDAGDTVMSAFRADSDYFAADRQVMLNLRVEGLDPLLARLEAAGIEVTHRQVMEGMGAFARIHDPDGNPVELWEPSIEG